jgi:hypothetical protein
VFAATFMTLPADSPVQGGLDPGIHPIPVTVEALGVDLEQDVDGMPGAFCDVGGRDSGVKTACHLGLLFGTVIR